MRGRDQVHYDAPDRQVGRGPAHTARAASAAGAAACAAPTQAEQRPVLALARALPAGASQLVIRGRAVCVPRAAEAWRPDSAGTGSSAQSAALRLRRLRDSHGESSGRAPRPGFVVECARVRGGYGVCEGGCRCFFLLFVLVSDAT